MRNNPLNYMRKMIMKTPFSFRRAKIVAICLTCLLSFGCSGTIDGWKVNAAKSACKEKGGIDFINLVLGYVVCNNGRTKELKTQKDR